MKKMFLISSLIMLSILVIYNLSFAQRYYRNARMDECLYRLDLTDKQIQEINRLEIQLEKELVPFISELRELEIKLDELEMQRSPDLEEIDKVMTEIYNVEDQIIEKENQYHEKIRNLLNDEQKSKLDSIYGYRTYLRPRFGRFGLGLGYYCFRGEYGWGAERGTRGYYGRYYRSGRYYNRYNQRFGYGRGPGIVSSRRFYNQRFNRGRFRW
ncbi:MAG: Spy/CpxP family protein refolding chaperone [Acidobacteriota bacterium]